MHIYYNVFTLNLKTNHQTSYLFLFNFDIKKNWQFNKITLINDIKMITYINYLSLVYGKIKIIKLEEYL